MLDRDLLARGEEKASSSKGWRRGSRLNTMQVGPLLRQACVERSRYNDYWLALCPQVRYYSPGLCTPESFQRHGTDDSKQALLFS